MTEPWALRDRVNYDWDIMVQEIEDLIGVPLQAKKGPAIEQPLNHNHPNPFDELDKSLGNNPDSTSGKDKKKNRFEHLEIETDGTDDSKGDSRAPAKQP